ncbi:MAG: HK97-gp10 family putative phage morphogenesis protein [Anaerolineaceae bacterium]
MEISVRFHLKYDRAPEIIAKYPKLVEDVVAKAAKDIQQLAQDVYVPVDTGKLMNSITVTSEGTTGIVTASADYAGYVEFGTYKMGAQPYMYPAAKDIEPQFIAAMEALHRNL